MKTRLKVRVTGPLALLGLLAGWPGLLGGCGGGTVRMEKPGVLALPPAPTEAEMARRQEYAYTARMLAGRGLRGIVFRNSVKALERWRGIEKVGVEVSRTPGRGTAGWAGYPIRLALEPGPKSERSETLAATLAELSASPDLLVLAVFDRVEFNGYSRVFPVYDAALPIACVVIDAEKLERQGADYTDLADELGYDVALVADYAAFWRQTVAGGRVSSEAQLRQVYEEDRERLRQREETALAHESEVRRERYFDYIARRAGPYNDGREVALELGPLPGHLQPLRYVSTTASLAGPHDASPYHAKRTVPVPGLATLQPKIDVRFGVDRDGRPRLIALPYVPYVGDAPAPSVINLRQYKDRWFEALRDAVIEEGRDCPYCRSAYPNGARFPDEATTWEWFLAP